MSNIEVFNLFTAKIFARLYERFPLPTHISPEDLATEQSYGETSKDDARQIAGHTLKWLSETGYIDRTGEMAATFRYVLSSKGFEILNASPFSEQERETPTLGEQLVTTAKKAASDGAKSEMKELVHKVIGWGVGIGIAGVKSHLGF